MPTLINDRTGELRAVLKQTDNYSATNDVTITFDDKGSAIAEFFTEVEEITEHLDRVKKTVEEIRKKYNDTFSIPQTDTKLNEEIESLTNDIKRLANKVRNKLKIMEQDVDTEREKNYTSAICRIKQMQHLALSRRFVDVMFAHSEIQDFHRERCKERIKRQIEITGKVTTDDEVEEMLESGNLIVFIDVAETQRAKDALADVEARYADIIKLEKNIKELHGMFMDVSILVENQGEMINNIENYVQNAADYTTQARKELQTARDHQKSLRKKKIIIAIVVLIVVVVIGLIIWLSSK